MEVFPGSFFFPPVFLNEDTCSCQICSLTDFLVLIITWTVQKLSIFPYKKPPSSPPNKDSTFIFIV